MTSSEASTPTEVLVVGETAAGRALAALLDRAGLGVAVAGHNHGGVGTHRPVFFHEAGLAVLERIGVARAVRAYGEAIDRVTVHAGGMSSTVRPSPGGDSPLLIDRRRLLATLDGRVPDDTIRAAPPVGISDTGDDVRVTFENGDRERFDLVVAADGPTSSIRTTAGVDPLGGPELHQWIFHVNVDIVDSEDLAEFWTPNRVATVTPLEDGLAVRILARADKIDDPHREETLRTVAAGTGGPLPALVEALDGRRPEYSRVRVADRPPDRYRGRIAVCGTVLRPTGFASGLDPTVGLLEARDLAAALARTPGDVDGALTAYAGECARRWTAVRDAATDLPGANGTYPPIEASGPLAELLGRRAVALGGVPNEDASPTPDGDPDWP